MIGELDVQFDQSAVKSVNEICKCKTLEGVSSNDFNEDEEETNKMMMKNSLTAPPVTG